MPGMTRSAQKRKSVSYSKWGYLFIAPFFLVFAVFSFVPLISTFYNSFYENYMVGLMHVGPKFVGLENYKTIFLNGDMPKYMENTLILWLMCFIPQVIVSLLLAAWFTNASLRIKGQGFFKTVIYLPNLIMAAAFSMLFYAIFSDFGPANSILMGMGMENPYRFLANIGSTRGLVALMNFLMWFGNTTILLMAAMLGVDPGLFEAAEIDGAAPRQIFFKITLPLIKPILTYVFITSMIGGIQMFDVPQILTNGNGNPSRSSMTLVMYLNKHLFSKNYGLAGSVSVILFVLCAVLSAIVYRSLTDRSEKGRG